MNSHKYILEPYKGINSRYPCPKCEKKEFVRYIDTTTGKHIASDVGRCNREQNCGYKYTPAQYFQDNGLSVNNRAYTNTITRKPVKPVSFIPFDTFNASLQGYEHNYFTDYLKSLFGDELKARLIERYYIGTSRHWPGAVVFWQIDSKRRVRTGKVMLYDNVTGKRRKEDYYKPTWVHTLMKLPEFNLSQCLFGEHLLISNRISPVAVCESEKTAMIASVYRPKFIWMATGGATSSIDEKLKALKGCNVTLYPDLGKYGQWNEIAKKHGFKCNHYLEEIATPDEKEQGLDLADYFTKFDYKDVVKLDTAQAKQKITAYWQNYPEALSDFRANPKNRPLYHNEFCREFIPVSLAEFEKLTLK